MLFFRNKIVYILILLNLVMLGCAPVGRTLKSNEGRKYNKKTEKFKEPVIRILLLHKFDHIIISGNNLPVEVLGEGKHLYYTDRIEVLSGSNLIINGINVSPPVVIGDYGNHRIKINNNYYTGKFYIYKNELILHLPIEKYLYGVVNSEMSSQWPLEALKAQAVVARTFAIYKMLTCKNKNYDIGNTLLFQKYSFDDYDNKIVDAVESTRGIIIFYKDKPIESFYHSCSGGITESAGNVFQTDLPYLRSVIDPYSKECRDFKWKLYLPASKIIYLIKKQTLFNIYNANVKPGDFINIKIGSRTSSGRVKYFIVQLRDKEYKIDGNKFRLAVGSKELKSLLIDSIRRENQTGEVLFVIKGRGYGHGVGMSQWGAKKMAELGFSYKKIISFYYRGVRLGKYYNLPLNFE